MYSSYSSGGYVEALAATNFRHQESLPCPRLNVMSEKRNGKNSKEPKRRRVSPILSLPPRRPYEYIGGPFPRIDSMLMQERADFAQKVAEVSAHWNVLETSASALFMILLAGEDDTAFTLYYEVIKQPRRTAQEQIFAAVCQSRRVPDRLLSEIMDLWDDIESVEVRRNDVIHALWAAIPGKTIPSLSLDRVRSG